MKVVVSIVIPIEKDDSYAEKLYNLCNVHPKPQRFKLKRTFRMFFLSSSIPLHDSKPVLLPLAMASRNLGTTAWSFITPMPGMPSGSANDLGLLERKNGKRNGVWEVKP